MSTLEDLLSRDTQRVWAASSEVAQTRDAQELTLLADHLEQIQAATDGLDLGGARYPNNERLKFALGKLEFWRSKRGCLCQLYPDYLFYNPEKEQTAGNVRILEQTDDAVNWKSNYHCECTICGHKYRVESGEYHYTWWQWKTDAP